MSSSKLSNHSTISGVSKVVSKKKKKTAANEDIVIRLSDLGIVKTSPSDMEIKIQGQRLLLVLDKLGKKLQVVCSFPSTPKENAHILADYLTQHDIEFIHDVCGKYTGESGSHRSHKKRSIFQNMSNIVNRISMAESKGKVLDKINYSLKGVGDTFIDPNMAQVMELLWSNKELREYLLESYNYLPHSNETILVNCIATLRDAAQAKLSTSAIEERNREKLLRRAWNINAESKKHIQAIKLLLEKQRVELGRQLEAKKTIVAEYTNKIEDLKLKFRDDIKSKIQNSEKDMSGDTQASQNRQTDLSSDSKAIIQQYETLLSQHLLHEKNLRNKRSKVETQLCSWLNKWDADIGERQAEFEEITKGYEEEKAELDALQAKFDEQEKEYVVLMAEKHEEERKIWEAKAKLFFSTRAVKILQRYWRLYLQRKLERKRAKKLGKPMVEKSKEAIETIAEPEVKNADEPTGVTEVQAD